MCEKIEKKVICPKCGSDDFEIGSDVQGKEAPMISPEGVYAILKESDHEKRDATIDVLSEETVKYIF